MFLPHFERPSCQFVISIFRREVDENCALLGYDAASSGNFLLTFRHSLSVPFSVIKMRPIGCAETSVRNSHYWLHNIAEERSFQFVTALKYELKS